MRRDVFQAIADPTRRAIILLIAFQSMTPNAIAEHFDTSRQAVSKHLRILTEEVDKWLEQFRKIWEGRFNELDNVLSNLKNKKK